VRLGRDLDLLALVSARLEESAVAAERDVLERLRLDALRRLADSAREQGRESEAEMYEQAMAPVQDRAG
jgi:hypothetical protein